MKDLLRKLRLIDTLKVELEIPKKVFVSNLRNHVDEGSTGMFSDMFDIFSSSNNEYKGHVGEEEFEIKRRRKFFDMHISLTVAKGTYSQRDMTLTIDTEISGFHTYMLFFYAFAIFLYATFIGSFFSGANENASVFFLFFLFIHACLMFSIPYFIMRRSVKRLKHDLEREFFYMTKQS